MNFDELPPDFEELFGTLAKEVPQTEEEKAKEWIKRKFGGLYPLDTKDKK